MYMWHVHLFSFVVIACCILSFLKVEQVVWLKKF